jgi:molybdopterin converting factor subunit 1
MQVRVLFFGILKESFGVSERLVELSQAEPAVRELLDALAPKASADLRALWPRLAVAVNQQYVRGDHRLHSGDEVALLPPVSGGLENREQEAPALRQVRPRVLLTHAPLATGDPVDALKAGGDGAVVVFDGIVRNNTRGRETSYLYYEAYEEMAASQMQGLVNQALDRFAVRDALLHHRLGRLEIGETSVLIAIASAHRGAAFEACRWMIDTLKTTVPIWKKEFFFDGAVWADGEPFPVTLSPKAPSPQAPDSGEANSGGSI